MILNPNDQKIVFVSLSREPVLNLAFEEWLLKNMKPDSERLFLYENNPAVVMGRFQNPWRECRTGLAERSGYSILRRISGGGCVVHGPGNLNFAVFGGFPVPRKAGNLDAVIRTLASLGVTSGRNDRFDLTVDVPSRGVCKVSGSAFRQTAGSSLHHATLLVDARLKDLSGLLHAPKRDMDCRGVGSRPSPVANLSDLAFGLTVGDVVDALAESWNAPVLRVDPGDLAGDETFDGACRKLADDAWIWGKTPAFTERFRDLPGLEGILEADVKGGLITAVRCPEPHHADFLKGLAYRRAALRAGSPENPPWLESFAAGVDGD